MRPVFMGVKVKLWSCAVNAAVSLSFVLASFLFSGGCFAGFARLRVMSNACLFAACATKSTMRSFWNHFKGRRGSLRHETVHRSASSYVFEDVLASVLCRQGDALERRCRNQRIIVPRQPLHAFYHTLFSNSVSFWKRVIFPHVILEARTERFPVQVVSSSSNNSVLYM